MDKYEALTDKEVYMLSRALIESAYEIQYKKKDLYSTDERILHNQLLNELTEERRFRQYFKTEGC